jgi:hypothetical protein
MLVKGYSLPYQHPRYDQQNFGVAGMPPLHDWLDEARNDRLPGIAGARH